MATLRRALYASDFESEAIRLVTGGERVMWENSIRTRSRREFKVTTDGDHSLPVSVNELDRNFTTGQPNRVWTGDISSMAFEENRDRARLADAA